MWLLETMIKWKTVDSVSVRQLNGLKLLNLELIIRLSRISCLVVGEVVIGYVLVSNCVCDLKVCDWAR